MSQGFSHKAELGINLDIDETSPLTKNTGKFIKNLTTAVNVNADSNTPQIAGNNQQTWTPLLSNEIICDVDLPQGQNYCIGSYNNPVSKETYCHVWNSEGNHFNYRINEDLSCEKVYTIGSCLNYQLQPQYFLPQIRNELFYKCETNLFNGKSQYIRDWVFSDGFKSGDVYNWQKFIAVNDSIATQSFTRDSSGPTEKFRFSNVADTSNSVVFDPCEYIQLIPRSPLGCIGIEELQNVERQKNNFLLNKTWQFRVKFFDVWGRESEHGVISNLYVPTTSNCQSNSEGLPRCLALTIEAGSPIVAKIQIEFRNCVDTNSSIETTTDWYIYDTVDKYGDCGANDGKDWYDRVITLDPYEPVTNTFVYTFCADRECTPIPVSETNRTQNDLPITSGAIVRVGNGLALANNLVGYEPVPCEVVDLLNVEYEAPQGGCKIKYCDIEFWAVIHNPFVNVNEFVYNKGGTPENGGYTGGAWSWGGIGKINNAGTTVPEVNGAGTDYGQTFAGQTNNQQNFYAYLEGTDFKAQGFQQLYQGGVLQEWGGELLDSNFHKREIARRIKNGSYYLQHFSFKNVPHGKYLARIAGHNNSMDSDYQSSSTYVAGIIIKGNYLSTDLDFDDVDTYYKELEINTCDFAVGQNFTTDSMFMICDLTAPDGALVNSRSNAYFGYLKDSNGNPVELSPVVIKDITGFHTDVDVSLFPDNTLVPPAWDDLINKTDHNGFWFCACTSIDVIHWDTSISFLYFVESDVCTPLGIEFTDHVDTFDASASEIPLTVNEGLLPNYAKCQSITIRGLITDCNNHPVSGVVVCYTRSKSSTTNNLGYFDIVIHNDISTDFVTVLGRELGPAPDDDRIFMSQNGLCAFVKCNNCDMCVDVDYNLDINDELDCFECDDDQHKTLDVITTRIRFPFSDQRGIKLGSKIKFGIKQYDPAGRHTFVGTDDSLYLDIPKAQQQLSQSFGKIKYTLTNHTFPAWVKYIGFYWTDQNAYVDYLDFVISSVDPNLQSGKIALGFQSIINYNTDNNFKTNTTWEFIKGDRIEFIADENGNFFDANNPAIGILNFQIEGNTANNSGIIDYDSRLANLKVGTLIQLQRPKECNTELFYYEICSPIKLNDDRQIPTDKLTGYFNIWNSYLVSRKIRYLAGGVDSVHSFPFFFESQSPSDFWGGKCSNRGRVNTVNPFEQQYCINMGGILSDDYITNINGLSRYDSANSFQFSDNGYGSITAMITKGDFVLFICSKSSFTVAFKDNTLQVDTQQRVIYNPAMFSKPAPINKELGAEMVDVSTIVKCDGVVMFLDRNNSALVVNNFSNTDDISRDKFYGYLNTKLTTVIEYNLNPQSQFIKYFHAAYNPEFEEYIITQFDIPKNDSVVPTYINEDAEVNEQSPETFAVRISDFSMRSYYSFTPEFYSIVNDKLISFKGAQAYMHGIRNINSFNKFYGTQCIAVFDFVSNCDSPDLTKYYQWHEIHRANKDFYATKITTQLNQLSEVPLNFYEIVEEFETSDFLCDINTFADPSIPALATAGGRLVEGDTLKGTWIRIKLLSDTPTSDAYFELQGCTVFCSGVQKSGNEGLPR